LNCGLLPLRVIRKKFTVGLSWTAEGGDEAMAAQAEEASATAKAPPNSPPMESPRKFLSDPSATCINQVID
jgi:hypothetical protein